MNSSTLALVTVLATIHLYDPPAGGFREGSSPETAIVLAASDEREATRLEFAWLAQHFPGARLAKEEQVGTRKVTFGTWTLGRKGRVYEIRTLVLADGSPRSVYFDVAASYPRGSSRRRVDGSSK